MAEETKVPFYQKKTPYETAAFIIFSVLLIQQVGLLIIRLLRYLNNADTWFQTANLTTPAFFARIVNIDLTADLYLLLGLIALVLWYILIYVLVFKYSESKGYAKWTWTLLVMFGPTILLTSPLYFYAAYVFRPYLMHFIKKVIAEYKSVEINLKIASKEEKVKKE